MKKVWDVLSAVIIVSLVVPMGVFASPINLQVAAKTTVVSGVLSVKVVTVRPTQVIVPEKPYVSRASACTLEADVESNLVQNAESVNLNQPASCFSLSPAKLAAQAALAVVPFHTAATVVVASHSFFLNNPSLAPSPLGRDAALPVLVFAAFTVILFEERRSVQKETSRFLEIITQTLTLHQLGVLRC